ncbi:2-hydroxychromene-2-carboxylate isomerase [Pseudomonas sp. NY15437]|uniref:2-hydroxychromene-2-carboxylate isomerase n=1 Tax=Pseudomonas sp. NY15437 TaxID=3400360 RepID=UPI003A85904F
MIIDFYFDFMSPFSYLAHHKLRKLARQHDIAICYHAVDLARLKKAIGNVGPSNRDLKVKFNYLQNDLQRWADIYGIPLNFPPNYNSQRINTGLYYPGAAAREAEYVCAMFSEVWGGGVAPDADSLLEKVANDLGWTNATFLDFLNSAVAIDVYEAETGAAIDRKIFGVPTICIGNEMWWGNDRLFMVEKFIKERSQA